MLLDGYGLVYRAFFALPDLTTSKGTLVKGVFGFASIVLRGLQDLKPDYLAVSFDLPGPTFRHEQYAEYKATRTKMPDELRDQFPMVREVVKALRIPVYELQGYEADDVIGTITRQMEPLDVETTIVTVDLDMLQLVTPKTRLMTTRSGVENTVIYDVARIDERFGLRPDQMIDYKALKGDPTDNIPGVPGVGEKTAAKLIGQYGHLEGLFEQLETVTPEKLREKLRDHRDQVFLGRELSRIVRDLPVTLDLEAARLGDYDRETVVRLFREYEFRTLIDRLPPLLGEDDASRLAALRGETASGTFPAAQVPGRSPGWRPPPAPSGGQLALTLDFDTVSGGAGPASPPSSNGSKVASVPSGDLPAALKAAIADPGRIEVVEADGVAALEPWLRVQSAVGLGQQIADPRPLAGTPHALAVAGMDGRVVSAAGPAASVALRQLVEAVGVPLVAHDVKPFLVARLAEDRAAVLPKVAFDTQIAAYLVNAALRSQKIDDVVAERLGGLVLPPPAANLPAVATAGLEALGALASRPPLEAALAEEGVERLFAEVELPLVPILARMEANGVALDRAALTELDAEFKTEIQRLERAIFDAVGHEFTIGSPKQLGDILFVELGLPKGRRTKTGYSTDAAVLEELAGRPSRHRPHPRVADLHEAPLDLRGGAADPAGPGRPAAHDVPPGGGGDRPALVVGSEPPEHPHPVRPRAADPARLRLRRARHRAARGRLQPDRAADPRARVRRRASAGRLRARGRHPSRDRGAGAPQGPARRHRRRAVDGQDGQLRARVRDERLRAVEPRRDQPPGGAGVHQLVLRGVLRDQLLHDGHQGDARRRQGHVATLLGRKRRIPELQPTNRALRRGRRADGHQHAHPGHGRGHREDRDDPPRRAAARAAASRARLLLQVHDELLLEAPEDEVDRLVPVLRETMEGALPLSVPLTVDVKVGRSWEGMTPVSRRDAVLAEADELPPEPLAGVAAGS